MDDTEVESQFMGGRQPSTIKETRSNKKLDSDAAPPASNGCFDCNICLDYAAEPVVTLCGHLYCWPCIYKWLQQESSNPPQCPVCKAALSETALVPLYGRGYDGKAGDDAPDVPSRPSVSMTASVISDSDTPRATARYAQGHAHHRPSRDGGYTMPTSSAATAARVVQHPTLLGGTAIAVLPWVLGEQGTGLYYSGTYPVVTTGDSPRLRQQEMKARRSLHRISTFLFCCAVLCLLVF